MSKEYLEALKILGRALEFNDEGEFQSGRLWRVIFNDMVDDEDKAIIEQALQRLESIDNANPSEALEKLDYIENEIKFAYDDDYVSYDYTDDVEYIKQALLKLQELEAMAEEYDLQPYQIREALLVFCMMNSAGYKVSDIEKAQEQEKVLKIIKEKNVDVQYLRYEAVDVRMYNDYVSQLNKVSTINHSSLTEEEFDLLKRYFNEQDN